MIRTLSLPMMVSVAVLGAASLIAEPTGLIGRAKADHDDLCFHGTRLGFAGEASIVDAMVEIDAAYEDHHRSHRRAHARVAMHHLAIAEATLRSPLVRRELAHAQEHLDLFLYRDADRDLELASHHLQTAWEVARTSVVLSRPPIGRPPVVVPSYPPVVHPPVGHYPAPIHRTPGISFGDENFRVRINF